METFGPLDPTLCEDCFMPLTIKKDWLTIGEVSELTGVPIHTLRFWESEFSTYFSPIRTNGRQRRYNEEAVDRVLNIKFLLKEEKYSIAGAKQVLDRQLVALNDGAIIGHFPAIKDVAFTSLENSEPSLEPSQAVSIAN
jgi:DNA-binding transcriptional MerR regulator